MLLFKGRWRKASILPLSTLVLGWLVYLVGFILLMVKGDNGTHQRFDHLPHYIAVATPPVLVVLAGLHTALFGLASSILGFFAALTSVVCFSATGYVLNTYAISLYHQLHFEKSVDAKSVVMFSGALLSSISWVLVLVMWNYFTYKPRWGDMHSLDDVTDSDSTTSPPPRLPREPRPFAGVARKVALVFLILKTASWCVLVKGVDDSISSNSSAYSIPLSGPGNNGSTFFLNFDEISLSFSTWTVCVIGILLVLSETLHAGSNGDSSSLVGAFTSVLSQLFTTCLGYLIFTISINVYHKCQDDNKCTVSTLPRYWLYQLCGGVGIGVMWACILALWPFYFKPVENLQGQLRSVQNQNEYYFRNQNERLPLRQSNQYSYRSVTPIPSAPAL